MADKTDTPTPMTATEITQASPTHATGSYGARAIEGLDSMREALNLRGAELLAWSEAVDADRVHGNLVALASLISSIMLLLEIQLLTKAGPPAAEVPDAPTA